MTHNNVLCILNVPHEDIGSFDVTMRGFSIKPQIVLASQTDFHTIDPLAPDLTIIMGGPMGVYEADQYPFLSAEMQHVRARAGAGKPVLGVCLGSQIIAAALGAKVYPGTAGKEIGWSPIQVTAAGMQTPLKYLDESETSMMHWHGDTFDLPDGAKLLASSARYKHQAYLVNDNILGLQCHPEVTEARLESWYREMGGEMEQEGLSVENLRAQAHQHAEKLSIQNQLFFTEWLGLVAPNLLEKRQPVIDAA